ncbi:hypothetical protein HER10_EVM0010672 [Colletotrichum scovillei]|uniref:Ecp2 effector protein domain-containing protein n=1 Tax=Colletotrichum scovillei TaxID=1209932 RepID=A0A9P7UL49_9PEZI|nr:uncharacterized protein HER10_EVM0010672 [Colletotrichum scovillei]KAF4777954.1 hypothetical protein HER10_EVM0010672 [Colletotrichum scovillei]KAG7059033.1 hypothetical protein JMJ77_0006401 [Colletotrichum scovillei]KAG7077675.1 hypothetical protein JMJ76_0014919 [Colletotrichum scovillei]KAG7084802.1 hypothetical protein JMJ78_0010234 [Colletotrichum scovillei]
MVNVALSTLAVLAAAPFIGAIPTATQSDAAEVFSFAKWVDGIIANPEGDNLTPSQAVEAWRESVNATESDGTTATNGLLQKRVTCNTVAGTEASVPDAVSCINDLARKGSQACVVSSVSVFCLLGNAQITGVKGGTNAASTSSACNDVARAGGLIMDSCTRADNTVQGQEFAWGNGNLLVHIRRPGL